MKALTYLHKNEKDVFVRWTLNERIQHWVLAVSFILLVLTGFGLKYPQAWWVRPLAGIEWLFDLRGLLHRIAGAIFILLGGYHVIYMLRTPRGQNLLRAFRPGLQDVRDLRQNLAYNFGLRPDRPQFGHFSYIEKAEYIALIWGAIIMGVTGIMLWFEGLTLLFFPKWVIDLLTVIHLYEAWLATLAIVVWHFYSVIINPDVYPLNTGMINGQITDKELRQEYTLEWKQLQEAANEDGGSDLGEPIQEDQDVSKRSSS
ncbi:cytochrome b/b6 domain-containing protein [bacterium]|nr:cytochrome b/b6 domain-containing protein [bacterium]